MLRSQLIHVRRREKKTGIGVELGGRHGQKHKKKDGHGTVSRESFWEGSVTGLEHEILCLSSDQCTEVSKIPLHQSAKLPQD